MKSKFFIFALAAIGFSLSSCDKFVEPETSKVSGDLEGCFELTGEKYKLTKSGDENEFTVTIKRTEQSVPYGVAAVSPINDDDSDNLYLAGFGYTLLDKDGNEILKVKPSKADYNDRQLLDILKLKPGQEGELTIKVDKDVAPAKVKLSSAIKFYNTGKITFDGSIGKYGIKNMEVEFNFKDNEVKGKYQYSSSPAGAFLWWKGTVEEKELEPGKYVWSVSITETNPNNEWCGSFIGDLVLSRDSEKDEYFFTLPGKFTNFRFDNFQSNLTSPVLSKLYKSEGNDKDDENDDKD